MRLGGFHQIDVCPRKSFLIRSSFEELVVAFQYHIHFLTWYGISYIPHTA